MLSEKFLYGLGAGALLGWWLNRRAAPKLPGPYEPTHPKYSGLRRFR